MDQSGNLSSSGGAQEENAPRLARDIGLWDAVLDVASLGVCDVTNASDNKSSPTTTTTIARQYNHSNRLRDLIKAKEFHEYVIFGPKKSCLSREARSGSVSARAEAQAAGPKTSKPSRGEASESTSKSTSSQVFKGAASITQDLITNKNNNQNTYNTTNDDINIITNQQQQQQQQQQIVLKGNVSDIRGCDENSTGKNTQNLSAKLDNQQRGKSLRSRYRRWKLKFWMSFCCMGYQKNKASIADVTKLMSRLYSGPNMGLSHIAACLLLLKKFQEAQQNWLLRQPELGIKQFLSSIPITDRTPFLDLSTKDDAFLVNDLIYFMNYSLSIFGWPLYAIDGLHQVCCLIPYMRLQCCGTNKSKSRLLESDKQQEQQQRQRQQQQAEETFDSDDFPIVLDDNWVGCNLAAANRRLSGHNYDIIYVNYQSAINVVPFMVVADHSKQTVVVAIRGSMALSDAVIDLNVMIEPLPLEPERPEMYGHRGMILSANHVRQTLIRHRVLEAAFGSRPDLGSEDYTLLFCGHSLGGGVASILGLLFLKEYPNLKAYLYSPPGGILSLAAVDETKKFSYGVFLGNDCVPRAGLTQIERLKYQSFWAKKRTHQSNGSILARAFGRKFCCCGADSNNATATSSNGNDNNQHKSSSTSPYEFDPANSLDICFGQKENCPPFEYKGQVFEFPAKEEALFVPGKLIHVVKDYSNVKQRRGAARNPHDLEPFYHAIWVENTDYDRIVVDDGMLMDHMPFALMHSLKMLFARTLPPPKTKQPKSMMTPYRASSPQPPQTQRSWIHNSSIIPSDEIIVNQQQILGTQCLIRGNNNNNEDKILIADEEAIEKQRQYQRDDNNNDNNNNNNNDDSQTNYYDTKETNDNNAAFNLDNNNNLNFANLNLNQSNDNNRNHDDNATTGNDNNNNSNNNSKTEDTKQCQRR